MFNARFHDSRIYMMAHPSSSAASPLAAAGVPGWDGSGWNMCGTC
jgi:hypothetical protein